MLLLFLWACNSDGGIKVYSVPPTVEITSHQSGDVFFDQQAITFRATITDIDEDTSSLRATWFVNEREACTSLPPDDEGESICVVTLELEDNRITVEAKDGKNNVETDSIDFSVETNLPPEITDLILTPEEPTSKDSLLLTVSARDPENAEITLQYQWFQNGIETEFLSNQIAALETQRGDNWKVVVTPNDGYQDGVPQELEVSIANSPPNIDLVEITSNGGLYNDSEFTCAADYGDWDEDDVSIEYSWEVGGTVLSTENPFVPTNGLMPGADLTCVVTANDGTDSTTNSASVTIENRIPIISSVEILPAEPYSNDDLELNVATSDPDGSSLSLSYQWSLNNIATSHVGDSFPSSDHEKGDVVKVTVIANDGEGDSLGFQASTTILNTPPTTPNISLSSTSPTAGNTDIICSVDTEATDADGDSLSYVFAWELDGSSYTQTSTTNSSGDTIQGSNTQVGQVWQCVVRAFDGDDYSDPVYSDAAMVAPSNASPNINDLQITPTTPLTTTDIEVSYSVEDPEGDAIVSQSISWYVDGSIVGGQTSNTLPSSNFVKGQSVYAEVSASDPYGMSTQQSNTVFVKNTPAEPPSISIDGGTGIEGEQDLLCNIDVASIDVDGDTSISYTFEWELDGNVYTGAMSTTTYTNDTIPAVDTVANQNWVCIVTPNDGDLGTSNSANSDTFQVLSANAAPVFDVCEISPIEPTVEDEISVYVETSDAEGDAIEIFYEWSVNGSPVSGQESDTLEVGNTLKGDTVEVIVRAEDETSYSECTQIVTVVNALPEAPTISWVNSSVVEGQDDLTCRIDQDGYDADGDTVTHRYEWTLQGSANSHNTETISKSNLTAGQTWTCQVYPSDDGGITEGEPSSVIQTTVQSYVPPACYAYVSNSHEISSCVVSVERTQETCVPASGVTVCYPQYCDSNPSVQQHNADGSDTGAYCPDWGQCEGTMDVSGQSGWSWVGGYWSCTTSTNWVDETQYGGANCGYYYTCDNQQVSCGTGNQCTP